MYLLLGLIKCEDGILTDIQASSPWSNTTKYWRIIPVRPVGCSLRRAGCSWTIPGQRAAHEWKVKASFVSAIFRDHSLFSVRTNLWLRVDVIEFEELWLDEIKNLSQWKYLEKEQVEYQKQANEFLVLKMLPNGSHWSYSNSKLT